jgi:hydrogenase maturation protein HypF
MSFEAGGRGFLAVIETTGLRPDMPPTGGMHVQYIDRETIVSPDLATCVDCVREMFDPADRRFRYAFVSCVNCGPRFTIAIDVPYDRTSTTMSGFRLCADCTREYQEPAGRRFHAQATCCPACGPRLRLVTASGAAVHGDPIVGAARLLRAGRVVAIKGLGGYHLAVDALDENAAVTLRSRKQSQDRPFPVMVPDLATAERFCELDEAARGLLTGARRPIVLLPRRADAPVAASVAPDNRYLGIMLPYSPLHHLLAAEFAGPFVLTGGNAAGEPIASDDDDAFARLGEMADAFLTHDRPIRARADDSVILLGGGRATPLRRSRGYAPQPLPLHLPLPRPVLGCGAELKNTFCLAKGSRAFVSQHIGDLEDPETLKTFSEGVTHFGRLFDIEPRLVAHDLHPGSASAAYALALQGVDLVGVQHHHAHIASCLADNEESGPVIGVAFDGLGHGADDTLWGGELLVADLLGFVRAGHLAPVRLPGGALAIREPWRMAAAYIDRANEGGPAETLAVRDRHESRWDFVVGTARSGANSPLTSSASRLFDAVAAILGVRDAVAFEGQAGFELEQHADPSVTDAYPVLVRDGHPLVLDGPDLVRCIVDDLGAGTPTEVVAARFHNSVVALIAEACERIRGATGVGVTALSGAVFQNRLLLDRVVPALTRRGFRVLTHRRVPPGDGGVSLGQVAVAAARDISKYGTPAAS